MTMHGTEAQWPMHQEGTAIGVMSWLVDVEP